MRKDSCDDHFLEPVRHDWLQVCRRCGAVTVSGESRGVQPPAVIADLENPSALLFNVFATISANPESARRYLDDVMLSSCSDAEFDNLTGLIRHVAGKKEELDQLDEGELEAWVRDAALAGAELSADLEEVQRTSGSKQVNQVAVLAHWYVEVLFHPFWQRAA